MSELSAEAIRRALTTRRLGHPVLFYERISSTNDVARERATAGAPEGLLVVADEQTAGRGRLDRSWWAPSASSLLMSLLLRPPIPPSQAGRLTMCLGLGAVEGIEEATGLRPALKWPNDLVLAGRKLGGILSELEAGGDRSLDGLRLSVDGLQPLDYAVLGLGVNVNMAVEGAPGIPAELAQAATSLSMALGRPVDRLPLLAAILARCEIWYERLLGGESPHAAWAARLDTLGRRVSIALPGGAFRGVAVGISPEGALLVQREDGELNIVWAGDVMAVR